MTDGTSTTNAGLAAMNKLVQVHAAARQREQQQHQQQQLQKQQQRDSSVSAAADRAAAADAVSAAPNSAKAGTAAARPPLSAGVSPVAPLVSLLPTTAKASTTTNNNGGGSSSGPPSAAASSSDVAGLLLDDQGEDLVLRNQLLLARASDDRRARHRAEDDALYLRHTLSERDRKLEATAAALRKANAAAALAERQRDERDAAVAALKCASEALESRLRAADAERTRLLGALRDAAGNAAVGASPTAASAAATAALAGAGFAGMRASPSFAPASPPRSGSFGLAGASFAAGTGLVPALAASTGSEGGANGSPPDSLGARRFAELLAERMRTARLTRQLGGLRQEYERMAAAHESQMMEIEDAHSVATQRCLARGMVPVNEEARLLEEDAKETARPLRRCATSGALVTFDNLRRYGRGAASELPFREKLDLRTPEEKYIDAKVKVSSFGAPFQALRERTHRFAHEWKEAEDKALSALLYIFTESGRRTASLLSSPKDDFHKEVKSALFNTKRMLFDLVKNVNEGIKDVLNTERRVKQQWITEARPSRDFGAQVDIPPPEDPRIAAQAERIAHLERRLATMRDEHEAHSTELELQKERAEVNMQFLQQRAFKLHDSVFHALHSVYKHRFHWAPRCPNAFQGIDRQASKKRQLEVAYNVRVGEAIDADVTMLARFTEYFVSDDLFGVDLAGSTNPTIASVAGAVDKENHGAGAGPATGAAAKDKDDAIAVLMRRKEPVPVKRRIQAARRLSSQVDDMLRRETRLSGEAPAPSSEDAEVAGVIAGVVCVPTPQPPHHPAPPAGRRLSEPSPTTSPDMMAPPTQPPESSVAALQRRVQRRALSMTDAAHVAAAAAASSAHAAQAAAHAAAGHSAHVPTNPEGFRRLEEWQQHQHQLWEAKRRNSYGGPPAPLAGTAAFTPSGPTGATMALMSPSTVTLQFDPNTRDAMLSPEAFAPAFQRHAGGAQRTAGRVGLR